MSIARGSVVVVDLDPTLGHEQRGVRPCVVVSDPEVIAEQRFPLLCVVPITGTPGGGSLYPRLAAGGPGGLRLDSYALIDHLRAVGKRRVRTLYGQIEDAELEAIDEGLRLFLGL